MFSGHLTVISMSAMGLIVATIHFKLRCKDCGYYGVLACETKTNETETEIETSEPIV